jgi:hypothetical protein
MMVYCKAMSKISFTVLAPLAPNMIFMKSAHLRWSLARALPCQIYTELHTECFDHVGVQAWPYIFEC